MSFQNAFGNQRQNLWLPRSPAKGKPKVELLKFIGDRPESVHFIHEWRGYFCFYSRSFAYLNKGTSLEPSKEIDYLPAGSPLLFQDDKIYMTLSTGPTVVWNAKFDVVSQGTTIPHSGGFADVIGMYPNKDRLSILNRMYGQGEQRFKSQIYTNTVSLAEDLKLVSTKDLLGTFHQSLLFGDRLILTSEDGFHFATLEGEILSSHHKGFSIRFGAVSPDDRFFGAFGDYKGDWSYLEFDSAGNLRFQSRISGRPEAGRVVFDDHGFRYVSSSRRIVKMDEKGDILWTKAVAGSKAKAPGSEPAPAHLVFADGGCAYVDNGSLIVLKPDGTEQMAVPLGGKKIASPPYLSEAGQFYLGLSYEEEDFIRISFKP